MGWGWDRFCRVPRELRHTALVLRYIGFVWKLVLLTLANPFSNPCANFGKCAYGADFSLLVS